MHLSIEKDHKNNEFVEKTFQSAPSTICLHLASDDVIPVKQTMMMIN